MRRWLFIVLTALSISVIVTPVQAGSEQWAIGAKNFNLYTAGFLLPNSVRPGEEVRTFVTCPSGSFTLSAFRMGDYGGRGGQKYWVSKSLPCIKQAAQQIDPTSHLSTSPWQESARIPTTALPPGFYLIKIVASVGHEAFMPLVVRQNDARGRVVFSIPTMTSLAYNDWRGANAYEGKEGFVDRARVLSFDRPNSWGFGSGKYLNYVHPLLVTAERMGLSIAYVTDVDVATIPNLLQGARAYVSGGHDEYWTGEERDVVEQARDAGTNLLFFGANVAYWQTRLAASRLGPNREMIIYKSAKEDPDTLHPTIRFRDDKRPEAILTGEKYNCFPATGGFRVTAPNSFIFQGAHVIVGETFSGIIGPEVDHVEMRQRFPGRVQVIAKSPIMCGLKHTSTEMIYGVSPSGAGTVAVGTMNWVEQGLTSSVAPRTRAFVTQVTKDLLLAASEGPLGIRYSVK